MSIEPEDMLEEALRADLPSKDAETRVRRRLLAAGIAVGNGVAATTAAASGAAGAASLGSAGVAVKLATLSWGVKVGLAAALAIPSAGLLWEQHHQRGSGSPVAAATAVVVGALATTEPTTAPPLPATDFDASAALATPEPGTEPARTRAATRRQEPSPSLASPTVALAPSRREFAPPHEPMPDRNLPAGTTLSEETRLLDRAFAALSAGNREAAQRLVAEHESRYPEGLLVKERERAKNKLLELSRGQ